MNPIDYVVIAVIGVILGAVILYIRKSRKKGVKCIGCPDGAQCSGNCSGCPGRCHTKY